jgi:hypothetical protein
MASHDGHALAAQDVPEQMPMVRGTAFESLTWTNNRKNEVQGSKENMLNGLFLLGSSTDAPSTPGLARIVLMLRPVAITHGM